MHALAGLGARRSVRERLRHASSLTAASTLLGQTQTNAAESREQPSTSQQNHTFLTNYNLLQQQARSTSPLLGRWLSNSVGVGPNPP